MELLPDELLQQVFGHLAIVGDVWEEDDPLRLAALPYHPADMHLMPLTGLRGYPFLAQVCRRWKRVLASPMTQSLVWRRVCVDVGHELVTSIHTPLRWSNTRPTPAEYAAAFAATSVSAAKVLRFLGSVSPHVRCLAVANSDGFEGEEGEFVSLAGKHDLGPHHLGFALALLRGTLTELVLYRCHSLLDGGPGPGSGSGPGRGGGGGGGSGVWSLAAQLPRLRVLAVEGLRGGLRGQELAALGELRKLEALVLSGEEYTASRGEWGSSGLDAIPPAWSNLTSLTRLVLRHHPQLPGLPAWLPPALPALRHLDLSGCTEADLDPITRLTQLHVLVLQRMRLGHELLSPAEAAAASAAGAPTPVRVLPDLRPLAGCLRSLSLAVNAFRGLPAWLPRLTRLEHLDMSYNVHLHITSPLNGLAALPHLRLLDFRSVHVTDGALAAGAGVGASGGGGSGGVWCEAKCTTMQHLAKLARSLKRRCPQPRLLTDIA